MSCAEALRRCPQAVFVRPRHALYRGTRGPSGTPCARSCPTVERTGLDEGYLDIGEVARRLPRARARRRGGAGGGAGGDEPLGSLGVATCKVVAKVASDRRKPGGLTVVRPGREAAFLAPFDVRLLPGVGPRAEERLARPASRRSARSPPSTTTSSRRLLPGKVGSPAPRSRARHRPATARDEVGGDLDLDRGDVRA